MDLSHGVKLLQMLFSDWHTAGIIKLTVDELLFRCKVGDRYLFSGYFWETDLIQGSLSAYCGESSSRRENNLTYPFKISNFPFF